MALLLVLFVLLAGEHLPLVDALPALVGAVVLVLCARHELLQTVGEGREGVTRSVTVDGRIGDGTPNVSIVRYHG